MRFKILLSLFTVCTAYYLQAQVPNIGRPENLEVATWNVEWYGDVGNGPSDLNLQSSRVEQVIRESNIDVWAFQEISNELLFNAMMSNLQAYSFTIATYSQTQKTAFVWKVSDWEFISSEHVLLLSASTFAGRPPLLLKMRDRLTGDTVCFINIHLKANTGSLSERRSSWVQRKNSSEILVDYIVDDLPYKTIVLGDWNDDIDIGTFLDSGTSLATILQRPEVRFVTEQISRLGNRSYVFSNSMIDHILIKQSSNQDVIDSLTAVLYLDRYFTSYASTVSDHFPVHASFKREKKPGVFIEEESAFHFKLYPNPSRGIFKVELNEAPQKIEAFDYLGAGVQIELKQVSGFTYEVSGLSGGVYLLRVTSDKAQLEKRLFVFD